VRGRHACWHAQLRGLAGVFPHDLNMYVTGRPPAAASQALDAVDAPPSRSSGQHRTPRPPTAPYASSRPTIPIDMRTSVQMTAHPGPERVFSGALSQIPGSNGIWKPPPLPPSFAVKIPTHTPLNPALKIVRGATASLVLLVQPHDGSVRVLCSSAAIDVSQA
jgi:hypothetical protein